MKKQFCLTVAVILFLTVNSLADPFASPDPNRMNGGCLHEIRAGLLAHDVDHLWSGSRKETGVDLNAEVIFKRPRLALLRGDVRPDLGVSINNKGDTSQIYGGVVWEIALPSYFFNIGIGAAVHNGELEGNKDDKKGLGARVLFRIPIEVGLTIRGRHRVSILFEHISNGYLAHPNEGLDSLGLRYGFLFN